MIGLNVKWQESLWLVKWFTWVIIWSFVRVKKTSVLAKSLVEAEYRAMSSVTCEIMWILEILDELKVGVEFRVPIS